MSSASHMEQRPGDRTRKRPEEGPAAPVYQEARQLATAARSAGVTAVSPYSSAASACTPSAAAPTVSPADRKQGPAGGPPREAWCSARR